MKGFIGVTDKGKEETGNWGSGESEKRRRGEITKR
jgi:hypothetical protein